MKIKRVFKYGTYKYRVYDGEELVARSDFYILAAFYARVYMGVKGRMDKFNREHSDEK